MSLCFLVYRTACTRSQQTSLPPCIPSPFHLQIRHRTHRYRQKQNFLPKPRFQFRKMSYCCRSNCQRHGVLLLLAAASSLLLLSVEISGAPKKTIVIGLKVLEDVLVSTDNDSSSATRSTSLSTTAARLHSRHSCTRHDAYFILLKSLLRTQPLDKERRSKQNRREVRSSLLVDRLRAM